MIIIRCLILMPVTLWVSMKQSNGSYHVVMNVCLSLIGDRNFLLWMEK